MTNDDLESKIEELETKVNTLETDVRSAKGRAALALEQLHALALAIQRNKHSEIDDVVNNLEKNGVF